jgi:hypothetical protein
MDPRLIEAIQEILLAVLKVLAFVIGTYGAKYLKARFTEAQIDKGERIAEIVVNAVEQMAVANQIDYKAKFAEALKMARELAAGNGVAFTDEQWTGLIEAAVAGMKQIGGELKPKVA